MRIDDEPDTVTLPSLELPPAEPPAPEEIERRRALFARVMELREKIGPIGIPADDLIHEVRGETDDTSE